MRNKTPRSSRPVRARAEYYSSVSLRFNKSPSPQPPPPPPILISRASRRHSHPFSSPFILRRLNIKRPSRRCSRAISRRAVRPSVHQHVLPRRPTRTPLIVAAILYLNFRCVCGTHRRQRDGHTNCPLIPISPPPFFLHYGFTLSEPCPRDSRHPCAEDRVHFDHNRISDGEKGAKAHLHSGRVSDKLSVENCWKIGNAP